MKVFPYLSSCPTSSIGTEREREREGGGGGEKKIQGGRTKVNDCSESRSAKRNSDQ